MSRDERLAALPDDDARLEALHQERAQLEREADITVAMLRARLRHEYRDIDARIQYIRAKQREALPSFSVPPERRRAPAQAPAAIREMCSEYGHGDPDNSGQCIYCGLVFDPDDRDDEQADYIEAHAEERATASRHNARRNR